MNEIVTRPLILKRKSKSSRFASWRGEGNSFLDKLLRSVYIFLLFAINFVMFIYSINGRIFENGVANEAVLVILGCFFVLAFVVVMLASFSKNVQNGICAFLTAMFVAIFYYQFAVFDADSFLEDWFAKKASWLAFICIIPSAWIIGLLFGGIIFFVFKYTFGLMFFTLVLLIGFLLGISKNETIDVTMEEYSIVKELKGKLDKKREGNIVYFMIPKLPSYQFLSGIRNTSFRELRNLIIGFYASNDFEVYPNAFVEHNKSMDNVVDIVNQVDYSSTTSKNRGYYEPVNEWNFIRGGLNTYALDENRLYEYLQKRGYGVSTYAMPSFNICMAGGGFETDRCVIKGYKTVSMYDKDANLEKNVYTLLTEWILNLKRKDLKQLAKDFARKSSINGVKVTAENRRVSIEGAPRLFDLLGEHIKTDTGAQVYLVYVDLPSDVYIYDEFCNVKPRKDWIALKDNSFSSGGIDEKRKAYVEQTKCLIGKMQEFMDVVKDSGKITKTDVFVQGVSSIRELGEMTGGRYSNFVTDRLVSLGIRKAKNPRFLINANVCLASDFTKTLIRFQDYCYSIDNMKMDGGEAFNLKKNLINNSVIRGGKITSIVVNYKDWYESFKQNSLDYQEKVRLKEEKKREVMKAERERLEREKVRKAEEEVSRNNSRKNISQENIFIPTDELSGDVEHFEEEKEVVEIIEDVVENKSGGVKSILEGRDEHEANVSQSTDDKTIETVEEKETVEILEDEQAKEKVDEIVEDVVENKSGGVKSILEGRDEHEANVSQSTDDKTIETVEEKETVEVLEDEQAKEKVDEIVEMVKGSVSQNDIKEVIEVGKELVGDDAVKELLVIEKIVSSDEDKVIKENEAKAMEALQNKDGVSDSSSSFDDKQTEEESLDIELDF